jgi:hypothetical protein
VAIGSFEVSINRELYWAGEIQEIISGAVAHASQKNSGIALAAALLMSEFGLAPWTTKRARVAIISVYKRARAASASPKEAADALLVRLRKLVHAGTRFPVIHKGQSLSPDQAKKAWGAIWTLPNSKRTILIRYDRLKLLVQPSAVTNAVLRELAAREILLRPMMAS